MTAAEPRSRPCQGCGKPLPVAPPFTGREAVWACMDCYLAEHRARLARRSDAR